MVSRINKKDKCQIVRRLLKKEEFIERSNRVHNNKYDYSHIEYINTNTKVSIFCNKHGNFDQTPMSHLSGRGCPECGNNKKVTNDEFIERCSLLYGNKYDYSLTKYLSKSKPVKIICPEHGVFESTPQSHFFKKVGCKECKGRVTNTDEFIKKSTSLHGDKYDYSLVEYKNNKSSVKIICPEHGVFEQIANYHLSGCGCKLCGGTNEKTNECFINICKTIHGDLYDYSLVEYKNNRTKVKIICTEHRVYEQVPYSHTGGSGCPSCYESKGEREVKKYLDDNNIKYESQKKFNDCLSLKSVNLRFDFYLYEKNICIEYDGEQHFHINEYFGGEDGYKKTKQNDNIKNDYCLENNIKLIRISYCDFNKISEILDNAIK
jgi:hypothetical protein